MTINAELQSKYVQGTWRIDPAHSEVSFSVRHLMIAKVRGVFEKVDVTIVTPEDPKNITIEAVIDVASVNTNQSDRDNHLRTSDFFLVDEHPTMTFNSTSLAFDHENFTIDGTLQMRGVTKPVTLKGEFGGLIVDAYGQTKAGATATTTINRHDFGVSWNAALEAGGVTLGDNVKIDVDIQVVLEK